MRDSSSYGIGRITWRSGCPIPGYNVKVCAMLDVMQHYNAQLMLTAHAHRLLVWSDGVFTVDMFFSIVFATMLLLAGHPNIAATSKWNDVKDEAEFTSLLVKHMESESRHVSGRDP
eukprot:scaffold4192_cov16-Tisochrysis_lutea.AAC.1